MDIMETSQESPLNCYEKREQNRGRKEYRKVSIFEVNSEEMKKKWKGLQHYVVVERERDEARETAFYITDLKHTKAKHFYELIRLHWGIENGLHFVKDVVHNEDKNRIRNPTGATLASLASSIAINISRKEQEKSISYSKIFFRSNVKEALRLIRT